MRHKADTAGEDKEAMESMASSCRRTPPSFNPDLSLPAAQSPE